MVSEHVYNKWHLLNLRRDDELRRRQLDLENELSAAATSSSGDTSANSNLDYNDYDWTSPSKTSDKYSYIGVDDTIHICIKMDREFLYVLTFLSLLYLLSQFTKKDFLRKFLASLLTRRRRSLDDINLGVLCVLPCLCLNS